MGVKPSILNAFSSKTPIIYTPCGPFIVCEELQCAVNVEELEADYSMYTTTVNVVGHTPWHFLVDEYMAGEHKLCSTFTKVRTGIYTWHKDAASGLYVPPGVHKVFREYSYSYFGSHFFIHTIGGTLAAILYGGYRL